MIAIAVKSMMMMIMMIFKNIWKFVCDAYSSIQSLTVITKSMSWYIKILKKILLAQCYSRNKQIEIDLNVATIELFFFFFKKWMHSSNSGCEMAKIYWTWILLINLCCLVQYYCENVKCVVIYIFSLFIFIQISNTAQSLYHLLKMIWLLD